MRATPAIHPSILNADLAHLADELARIESADGLHVDVMDNQFVPNLFGGPAFVSSVLAHTSLAVDAHLMIADADRWALQYAEMGCSLVTVHAEATRAPFVLMRDLHRAGVRTGLALRPATPLETVVPLLGCVDMLLLMTVEPGFGGQSFLEPMVDKIAQARRLIDAANLQVRVQIDGGVSVDTIERAAEAGADVFVAGSAVYRSDDAAEMISTLRHLAAARCCR